MLKDILSAHFAAYPEMEPQDAVKLIYQNEFGPGHLLGKGDKALQRLKMEMAELELGKKEPMYESIGNGLCRLNLRPCVEKGIPAEDIYALFSEAAKGTQGDKKEFRKKIRELTEMAENDETPFDAGMLDWYLIEYEEKGYPLVSHSETYRAAYQPAYRVVIQKKLKDYLAALRKQKKPEV